MYNDPGNRGTVRRHPVYRNRGRKRNNNGALVLTRSNEYLVDELKSHNSYLTKYTSKSLYSIELQSVASDNCHVGNWGSAQANWFKNPWKYSSGRLKTKIRIFIFPKFRQQRKLGAAVLCSNGRKGFITCALQKYLLDVIVGVHIRPFCIKKASCLTLMFVLFKTHGLQAYSIACADSISAFTIMKSKRLNPELSLEEGAKVRC